MLSYNNNKVNLREYKSTNFPWKKDNIKEINLHTDSAFQNMKTCTSLGRTGLWWNGKLLNWMFEMMVKALEYLFSFVGYSL